MLIDWFTVGAQVVNFVVLVWVMKRWVYVPLLLALDARERRIADELAGATAARTTAEAIQVELQRQLGEFETQRQSLLAQAAVEAEAERVRLVESARTKAAQTRAELVAAVQSDTQRLQRALTQRTEREILETVRRALEDLASARLEEQMCFVLLRRIDQLEPDARERMRDALQATNETPVLRSAFEWSNEQQRSLGVAVQAALGLQGGIRFQTHPGLICGVELTAGGQKLSFSVTEHLRSLEAVVLEQLAETERQSSSTVTAVAGDEGERVT